MDSDSQISQTHAPIKGKRNLAQMNGSQPRARAAPSKKKPVEPIFEEHNFAHERYSDDSDQEEVKKPAGKRRKLNAEADNQASLGSKAQASQASKPS